MVLMRPAAAVAAAAAAWEAMRISLRDMGWFCAIEANVDPVIVRKETSVSSSIWTGDGVGSAATTMEDEEPLGIMSMTLTFFADCTAFLARDPPLRRPARLAVEPPAPFDIPHGAFVRYVKQ